MMEGYLLKYVNIIQGWQQRYFLLDKNGGYLSYFLSEDDSKKGKIRGICDLREAKLTNDTEENAIIIESVFGIWKIKDTNMVKLKEWMDNIILTINKFNRQQTGVDEKKLMASINMKSSILLNNPSVIRKHYKQLKEEVGDKSKLIPTNKNILITIDNIRNNMLELHFVIQRIKQLLIKSKASDSTFKIIYLIYIIQRKMIEEFDKESINIIKRIRKQYKPLDIRYFTFPIFKEDKIKCHRYSSFKNLKSFFEYIKQNNTFKNIIKCNISELPLKLFQTRSIVQIIADSFRSARAIINLTVLPNDIFEQTIVVIRSYLTLLKSFIKEENFIGLPLNGLIEFTRATYSNNFHIGPQSIIQVLCQCTGTKSNCDYVFHVEDNYKTINIICKISYFISLIDDTIQIKLRGEGEFVHICLGKEYFFTLPDIIINNIYDEPSINIIGISRINNKRDNINVELHFLSSFHNQSNFNGYIHFTDKNYKLSGIWNEHINVYNSQDSLISLIQVFLDNSFAKFIPSYISSHICESKNLWKNCRLAIRKSNHHDFLSSYTQAINDSKKGEKEVDKIFSITNTSLSLRIKNFFTSNED